jgi:hypothetical protein
MEIRVHDIELCADQSGYSCSASYHGVTLAEFEAYLKELGFSTVQLPARGTVIGRRGSIMILAERGGTFVASRLQSRGQAESVIAELVELNHGKCR